ncbi:MAG: ribonuclease HII [Candidatus Ranarchaeia archaeon]|jgi:ribonuclease HII
MQTPVNPPIIIGIDEAGRGSVIGPLVVAGVAIPLTKLLFLEENGVKDSKALSPKTREELWLFIKDTVLFHEVSYISPEVIDQNHSEGQSLNLTELQVFTDVANSLAEKVPQNSTLKLIADAVDVNLEKCENHLRQALPQFDDISMEYQADANHVVVAAASIVAKVHRDEKIREIKSLHQSIGSGYPSDPKTVRFLKTYFAQHQEFPKFVRKSWETIQRIYDKTKNQALTDF